MRRAGSDSAGRGRTSTTSPCAIAAVMRLFADPNHQQLSFTPAKRSRRDAPIFVSRSVIRC